MCRAAESPASPPPMMTTSLGMVLMGFGLVDLEGLEGWVLWSWISDWSVLVPDPDPGALKSVGPSKNIPPDRSLSYPSEDRGDDWRVDGMRRLWCGCGRKALKANA